MRFFLQVFGGNKAILSLAVVAAALLDSAESKGAAIIRNEAYVNDGIDEETVDFLWEHYDCETYFETGDRPEDHLPQWMMMRGVYSAIVPNLRPSITSRLLKESTALRVPYSVRRVEGKGLGLIATERIQKGTLVYDGRRGGRVRLYSGDDFRRFINAFPLQEMVCLVLQCGAVESLSNDVELAEEQAYISVDLDDSCFANQADTDDGINVGHMDENQSCAVCDYALRDIEVGEELLMDYEEYTWPWEWFDLN